MFEPAIPKGQREKDQQAQQPAGIHGGNAGATWRQPETKPCLHEQMENVEEHWCFPEHDQRLKKVLCFLIRPG